MKNDLITSTARHAARSCAAGRSSRAEADRAICHLDCAYCFFLAKEMLYPGSRFRMADEQLENYIRQLIESHRTPEVTIAWQGGEPALMGLDFFKRSIEIAQKCARTGAASNATRDGGALGLALAYIHHIISLS